MVSEILKDQGAIKSLLAKLNAAQEIVDDGKTEQAENSLKAFINEVQAQSGKHITPEAAEILIESEEHIFSNLNRPQIFFLVQYA